MSKSNGELPDERGYVMIWRKIQETVWPQGPYAVTLWLHLLLEASHKDGHRTSHGVVLKRGQLHTSWIQLRRALGKPRGRGTTIAAESTVKALLAVWKAEDMLALSADPRGLLITVCNYDRWQGAGILAVPIGREIAGGTVDPSTIRVQELQEPEGGESTTSSSQQTSTELVPKKTEGPPDLLAGAGTVEVESTRARDEWLDKMADMWSDLLPGDDVEAPFSQFGRLRQKFGEKVPIESLEAMWMSDWKPGEDYDQGPRSYQSSLTGRCQRLAEETRRASPEWLPEHPSEIPEFNSVDLWILQSRLREQGIDYDDFVRELWKKERAQA